MDRWLITWVVTDRHGEHSYLMEVHSGPWGWEEAVVKKLETHASDSSYPGWAVVSVLKIDADSSAGKKLAKRLGD